MSEIFEKVVTQIKKLDDYYLLGTSKDLIFVGTKIMISEYVENIGLFQNYSKVVEKEVPIFFIVSLKAGNKHMSKNFIKNQIPILYLEKNELSMKSENIHSIFNNFISDLF